MDKPDQTGAVEKKFGPSGVTVPRARDWAPPAGTPKKEQKNHLLNVPKKQSIYANLLRNMGASFEVKK